MANFKFSNEWSKAAAVDERYRDPVAPLEHTEAPELPAIAAEMLDQADADANELPPVEWSGPTSPHGGSAPRKLTSEIMDEILRLRESGWTWPQLAARFNVHRRSIHAALKRR